jgi:hypothetical protein
MAGTVVLLVMAALLTRSLMAAHATDPGFRTDTYRVLMARTRGDAGVLLGQVRRELLAMEPNLVFLDNQTMEDQVSATLLPVRAGAWVVSVVGAVAMLLAGIGLYGVIAYSVARRTREMGIRMALGAQPSRVLSLVMRQGMWVTGVGLDSLLRQQRGGLDGRVLDRPVAGGGWAKRATNRSRDSRCSTSARPG